MASSMRMLCYILVLVAASSAVAQEKISIEVSEDLDAVSVKTKQFGQTSKNIFVVHTLKDSNERTTSFNRDIKELGVAGRIDNCSLLIDIPAGSKNHSYGGFCSLMQDNKKTNMYICNDEMVGHFALCHATVTITSTVELSKFVVSKAL
jgi:hypothetical protein